MTLRHRVLPAVPKGVAVAALAPNLKLFSAEQINDIKTRFIANGRYRTYQDEKGVEQKLKYPVFVFDGRYFAAYPGKLMLMGDSSFGKVKVVQDLDSGEWMPEKVFSVQEDKEAYLLPEMIENERDMLVAMKQAVMTTQQKPVNFFRHFNAQLEEPGERKVKDENIVFGGHSQIFKNDLMDHKNSPEEVGKYYLFMKQATGMNLQEWLILKPSLPVIVRLDMAISTVQAVMAVHAQHILHRDLKPSNLVFDMFKAIDEAVAVVDYGLSEQVESLNAELPAGDGTLGFQAPEVMRTPQQKQGVYSLKSDVYALGVTLDQLWAACGSEGLNKKMGALFNKMTSSVAADRPDLHAVHQALCDMKASLHDKDREVKICLLDVDEFCDVCENDAEYLRNFLRTLADYDQIRLFDSSDATDDQTLLAIKQKLESHRLVVASDVYVGGYKEAQAFVERHHQALAKDGRIYDITFLAQPVALRASLDSFTLTMDEIDDVSSDFETEEAVGREPLIPRDAEEYDVAGCMAWFFTSLWQDVGHIAENQRAQCGTRLTQCPTLFTRAESPEMQEMINYATDIDSSSEEELPENKKMI